MQSLSAFFEDNKPLAFAIMFAALLVLIIVLFLLYRLIFRRRLMASTGGRARQPRLGIVDAFDLDRQRQLVLVRRDNVEHLIMIGGPNDVVHETSIVRTQSVAAMSPARDKDAVMAPSGIPPQIPAAASLSVPAMAASLQSPSPGSVPAPSAPGPSPARTMARPSGPVATAPAPTPAAPPPPAAPPSPPTPVPDPPPLRPSSPEEGPANAEPTPVTPVPTRPQPAPPLRGGAPSAAPRPAGPGGPAPLPPRNPATPLPPRPAMTPRPSSLPPRPPLPPRNPATPLQPRAAAPLPVRPDQPPAQGSSAPARGEAPSLGGVTSGHTGIASDRAPPVGTGERAVAAAPEASQPGRSPEPAGAPRLDPGQPKGFETLESLEEEMAKLLGRTTPRREG